MTHDEGMRLARAIRDAGLGVRGCLTDEDLDALVAPFASEPRKQVRQCHHGRPRDVLGGHGVELCTYDAGHDGPCSFEPAPEPAGESTEPAGGSVLDLVAHLRRQRAWSEQTFGPGLRTATIIDHIRKELREIEECPQDVREWIDVVMLALDGAWRTGAEPEHVAAELALKLRENQAREWPDWRTVSEGKAIEHVRGATEPAGESAACPCGDPIGGVPCTRDDPCPYAQGLPESRWPTPPAGGAMRWPREPYESDVLGDPTPPAESAPEPADGPCQRCTHSDPWRCQPDWPNTTLPCDEACPCACHRAPAAPQATAEEVVPHHWAPVPMTEDERVDAAVAAGYEECARIADDLAAAFNPQSGERNAALCVASRIRARAAQAGKG